MNEIEEKGKFSNIELNHSFNRRKSPQGNTVSKTDLAKKRREAVAFVSKMRHNQLERQQNEEQRRREFQEKSLYEAEQQAKHFQEESQKLVQQRREYAIHIYNAARLKREQDKKILEEHRKHNTSPQETNYMHHKLEERYKREVELALLEERKKKLAEKRRKLQPLDSTVLRNHELRYGVLLTEQEERRDQERKKKRNKEYSLREALRQYETSISKKTFDRDSHDFLGKELRLHQAQQFRNKIEQYSKLVQETCPIISSEAKSIELARRIRALHHPIRARREIPSEYGLSLFRRTKGKSVSTERDTTLTQSRHKKLKPLDKIEPEIPKQEIKQIDYLAELRKKRKEKYSASKPSKYNWSADLKNEQLTQHEKCKLLFNKVEMIEEDAKMKEKLLHAQGGTQENLEMGDYISDMYLDAVRAKLAILDNLQDIFLVVI